MNNYIGNEIHNLAKRLWPINRSITGDGVRETLNILKEHLKDLKINEVPSGTKVFDWTVPKEWKVKEAYIIDPKGNKICDFSVNNLHLLGYSTPIHKKINLAELQEHLYSLPEQPSAIPYITSYYKERWGFCLSHNDREKLIDGEYEVFIDSELFDGSLTYGELIIPGKTDKEIFLSTYVCHPSMANNELSGPTVTTYLSKYIESLSDRKYTYRIVFIPETIGSITYSSFKKEELKEKVFAGFNLTCVGDDRDYSYLPSRAENTISDRIAKHVLKHTKKDYKPYTWSDRGSDERQYCAPGIDLPIASMMRTKYGIYPEYHTSLDNLVDVVTPDGLYGGYLIHQRAIEALEKNCYPKIQVFGEPQLGKRGLYPTLSTKETSDIVRDMMDLITYSDGERSLLDIAEKCNIPVWKFYPILDKLVENNLITI